MKKKSVFSGDTVCLQIVLEEGDRVLGCSDIENIKHFGFSLKNEAQRPEGYTYEFEALGVRPGRQAAIRKELGL